MSCILVTGGLGTVGTELVNELRSRGHEVWVCDLPHNHHPQYIRCDIGEFRELERVFAVHSFDYVYNLAAEVGRQNGEDYYEKLWHSNAVGMKNILRMQEKYRFRLVHFSSSEVYGDYSDVRYEDVLEKCPIRQMNDYAISKRVNELQIHNSSSMCGTETVIVRLFNAYGPGEYFSDYRGFICSFAYKALHDIPYTVYVPLRRTNIYITDCVRALAIICENFKPGEVYNIASTEYYDSKTLSDLVLKYAGKTDALVTYREPDPQIPVDEKVDNSKAVRDLGLKTTVDIEEGVRRVVEWMRKVYSE